LLAIVHFLIGEICAELIGMEKNCNLSLDLFTDLFSSFSIELIGTGHSYGCSCQILLL
jgi:hypothetical protein